MIVDSGRVLYWQAIYSESYVINIRRAYAVELLRAWKPFNQDMARPMSPIPTQLAAYLFPNYSHEGLQHQSSLLSIIIPR